jgi:argininosuccinate lyase
MRTPLGQRGYPPRAHISADFGVSSSLSLCFVAQSSRFDDMKSTVVSRSGRFAQGPAQAVADYSQSISFDWRLWKHDIAGSRAHAAMLQRVGLLTAAEFKAIARGLDTIAQEIHSGQFVWRPELEDVHMNIEAELTRRVPAGKKLHTGRSRNDQVALDMRLWVREEIAAAQVETRDLQRALVELAAQHPAVLIPGYTHLQRAQPVYLAHHLLAYVEMLDRDSARLGDCAERTNVCPLGSGALAGSTLPLDRAFVARQLGFVDKKGQPRLSQNSMDAVSDRDFAIEFCAGAALLAVHLSRLAEDLVLWAGSEFNFIRIADAYTTGSSLMPQKKNPDVAELTRGKSSRVIGNLVALLTLLKGLPMTYNRDLQEDKERLFDSSDTVRAALRVMAAMLRHTTPNPAACQAAVRDPSLLATDLADYLVQKGLPFREAHHVVGAAVALAEQTQRPLNSLGLAELRSLDPRFAPDVVAVFELEQAMTRRRGVGSPGTSEVRRQIARWTKTLARA